PIIRDAHRLMAGRDFWDLQPIHLTGDQGGVRARRTLARLIAAERGEDAALGVAAEEGRARTRAHHTRCARAHQTDSAIQNPHPGSKREPRMNNGDEPSGEKILAALMAYHDGIEGGMPEGQLDGIIDQLIELTPHSNISDLMHWGEKDRTNEEIVDEALRREA